MLSTPKSFEQLKKGYGFRKALFKAHVRRSIPWPIRTRLKSPIFIIGSSRSGTTMLTDILAAATEVCSFSEKPIVRRHMWNMVKFPDSLSYNLPQLEKTLTRLSGIKPEQRLLEKTPGHSLIAGALATYFPDGSFIHIIRDGRDVSNSMLGHSWISRELNEEVEVFWFPYLPQVYQERWPKLDLWERGVLRWAVYVTAARKAQSATERYFETSYEEVCKDPQQHIYRLFNFLELTVSSDCKQEIAKVRPVSSKTDKRKNLSERHQHFYEEALSNFGFSSLQVKS
ncbi:sulfotransferase [cf. Phormidesmis sp. LEGE 11477]|uniref:sulfotransferase family protein n=1 Tax=cf. Phormidesmis sp. LEGE 11477 TaxID=1828680 RepID=UPI001881D6CF|nr:sulfotransferase [cf. Phormidesmis sp. LEGE 11477]MBE9061257.1 sulfotransferase [cf. Phormidesmis sp. LEGE 11477]